LLCLLGVGPASANLVVEPSFAQKMERADLVLIGTVTAVDRGGRGRRGSSAVLTVLQRLKGESPDTLTVWTDSPTEERNPRCCEVGATYMMFLFGPAQDGRLSSDWGPYGMIRIGGPPSWYLEAPSSESITVPSSEN
jgi:hypothetical protein